MRFFLRVLVLLLLLCRIPTLYAQVQGCKDPAALNYNPAATITDGSCVYRNTHYIPPVKVAPLHPSLSETSGLQWAGGSLWTFNDGGGQAAIYKIDTLTNAIWQTVTLEGAINVDWEDIGFDGTFIYIGDIGNNNGGRTDLKIYKFPLGVIPSHISQPTVKVPADAIEVIHFSYADQPQPVIPSGANNTPFDCEAMIVDQEGIHLFTKDWVNKSTTHYLINTLAPGTYKAQFVETLATNYLVTGADKAIDEKLITLVGYNNAGIAPHYLHLLSDYSKGRFFDGNKRRIDLPDVTVMGQAEGIAFRDGTYGYISNERFVRGVGGFTITVEPRLRVFDLTQFIPKYILPIHLRNFTVNKEQGSNRISWQFEKEVPHLTIEHSTDSTTFNDLSSFTNTKEGSTTHQPRNGLNFYRLRWQVDNGLPRYSHIVTIQSMTLNDISHFVIKTNGELRFIAQSIQPLTLGIRLISQAGKLLGHKEPNEYISGRHSISFNTTQTKGSLVLVTVYDSSSYKTFVLQVQ